MAAVVPKIGAKTDIDELTEIFMYLKQYSGEKTQLIDKNTPHKDSKQNYSVLYIGPSDFSSIWVKKDLSQHKGQSHIQKRIISMLVEKLNKNFSYTHANNHATTGKFHVGYMSYRDFYVLVEIASESKKLDYLETYEKLLSGMKRELKLRGLS